MAEGKKRRKLTDGGDPRTGGEGTDNLEVYFTCRNALQIFRRLSKEDNILACKMFKKVIDLDPSEISTFKQVGSGMMVFWAFPKQISTLKRENLTEN